MKKVLKVNVQQLQVSSLPKIYFQLKKERKNKNKTPNSTFFKNVNNKFLMSTADVLSTNYFIIEKIILLYIIVYMYKIISKIFKRYIQRLYTLKIINYLHIYIFI